MSDIHYTIYDPDVLWDKMMQVYEAEGGMPLFPGDEKEMLLRAMLSILASAYAAHDYAARMRTLAAAAGRYLDAIGDTRGVARIAAEKAKCAVEITMQGGSNILLPAGTVFTRDGIMFYEVEKDVLVDTDTGEATLQANVVCTISGETGNRLKAGDELRPIKTSKTILLAVATADALGGMEQEDDDSYRERIRNAESIATTTGTGLAYKTRAMAVSANIQDARAIREEAGVVGVYLLIAANIPAEQRVEIVHKAEEALNAYDARPLCDIVQVSQAEIVPYKLVIGYSLDGDALGNVLTSMQKAISEYRAWQESAIGIAFDPFRLVGLLYNAGAARIEIDDESVLDADKPAEYTRMLPTQALRGSVLLRVLS